MDNQQYNILLVEDERLLRFLICAFLVKMGCQPDKAINGLEAVEKFKSKEYDLVLMDIQMPIMDGLEATRLIRKIEKKNQKHKMKRTMIVALTTNTEKEDYLANGMDLYYRKPILMKEICQIINQLDDYYSLAK